jgi:hypothetical protein
MSGKIIEGVVHRVYSTQGLILSENGEKPIFSVADYLQWSKLSDRIVVNTVPVIGAHVIFLQEKVDGVLIVKNFLHKKKNKKQKVFNKKFLDSIIKMVGYTKEKIILFGINIFYSTKNYFKPFVLVGEKIMQFNTLELCVSFVACAAFNNKKFDATKVFDQVSEVARRLEINEARLFAAFTLFENVPDLKKGLNQIF